MGLAIQPTRRISARITTLIAVFALLVQPMYGLVASHVASATNTHTTDLAGWSFSQSGSKGFRELAGNGLRVWTTSNDTQSKSAGYIKTPGLTLGEVTSTNIEFSTYTGVRPSLQLGVDRDGNGYWDGYLVYEPWAYGDGQYWTNKNSFGVAPGGGYPSMGTLADYQNANPAAMITEIGFSLGSGVKGDAVISKMTVGSKSYTFSTAPTITDLRYATVTSPKTTYSGIAVDFGVKNFTDATDCTITLHRANGTDASRTCGPDLVNHFNSTGNGVRKSTTTPFNVLGSTPGSWYSTTTGVWGPSTTPTGLTISINSAAYGLITASLNTPLDETYVPYANIAPADTVDPTFAITSPANGSYVKGIQTIDAEITDESDITKVLMNIAGISRSWANGSSSSITRSGDTFSTTIDTKTLPDGPVYTTLRGTDGAGNVRHWNNNSAHRQHVFTIDNTKPEVELVSPGTGAGNPANYIIKATDNLALKTVTGNIYDETNTTLIKSCSNTASPANTTEYLLDCTTPDLADGIYTIRYNALDMAGNISLTKTSKFTVDNTAPTVSIKSGTGANDGSLGKHPYYSQISFKLYDKNKNLKEAELNGHKYNRSGEWNDLNWSNINKSHLVTGENTIIVRDIQGNSSELKFFYDNVKPVITVKDDYVGDKTAKVFSNVSFKLSDNMMADKYQLNDSPINDFTDNKNSDANFGNIKSRLKQGENTITLYDTAGNSSSYTFIYDNTAPTISISNSFGGDTANNVYREVSFGYYDANKVVRAVFNGTTTHDFGDAMWSNTDTVWQNRSRTGVQEGQNTVDLYDLAGNKTPLSFTIDNTAPTVTINQYTAPFTNGRPTIGGTVTGEDTESVEVSLDNGATWLPAIINGTNWTFPYPTSRPALTSRNYDVLARAIDKLGNTGSAKSVSVSGTFSVAIAPAVVPPVTTPPSVAGPTGPQIENDSTTNASIPAAFVGFAPNFQLPTANNENIEQGTDENEGEVAAAIDKRDENGDVKAAQDSRDQWSIINLLLSIVVAALSVIALFGLAGKTKGERKTVTRLLTLIPVIGAGAVLLFVEDFAAPMGWVNIWTLLIGALLVVQMVLLANTKTQAE